MRDMRAGRQILHQEARITFEARSERRRSLERPLLVDRQLRFRAAATTRIPRRRRLRLGRLVHSAWLARRDVRPARPALQSPDLVTLRSNCPPKFRHLFQ